MTFKPDILVCEWCGENFPRPFEAGPIPKYCKPSHRQRAFEKRSMDAKVEKRARELAKRMTK